jgi:hypothetical protein
MDCPIHFPELSTFVRVGHAHTKIDLGLKYAAKQRSQLVLTKRVTREPPLPECDSGSDSLDLHNANDVQSFQSPL